MVKVDKYARVRRAHRDGMGIRELARTFIIPGVRSARSWPCRSPRRYQRLKSAAVDPRSVQAGHRRDPEGR